MESSTARSRRRARPSRRRPLLYTALAVAAVGGVPAGGTVYVKARAHAGPAAVSSASPSASSPAGTGKEAAMTHPAAVDRKARLDEAMAAVAVPSGAKVSVAVLATDSGDSAVHGTAAFDTASIVKVDILAALLLQAQDADRRLTAAERVYATKMIESSDNASATALWHTIGRAAGLDAANRRFGLTETSGGDGELWGLTQTTAADQLVLLQQVFGKDSKLSAASRTYLQGLLKSVEADQQWGVSAAAEGNSWALKNGWLARSTTGLWDVNSIGRVTVDGSEYLVAVLSNGTTTLAQGIALVEAAAQTAVSAFAGAGSGSD
ncbi:serine hydrolase [Streptomyces sp. NPDC052301]|uniref:serine hydrolase n=1 Tax=Streptomyces sp. NPDC052301 TaxID=3365687 RepID=UPI0037D74A2D